MLLLYVSLVCYVCFFNLMVDCDAMYGYVVLCMRVMSCLIVMCIMYVLCLCSFAMLSLNVMYVRCVFAYVMYVRTYVC